MHRIRRLITQAIALLMFLAFGLSGAWGVVYKYKDDQGKMHYTDNLSKIPRQYRDQLPDKFRPKPPPPPPAVEPKEGGPMAEGGKEGGEPGPAQGKAAGGAKTPALTKEAKEALKKKQALLKLMTEARNELDFEIRRRKNLFKNVRITRSGARTYQTDLNKSVYRFKPWIDRLQGTNNIALLDVANYMESEISEDSGIMGQTTTVELGEQIKALMEQRFETSTILIGNLDKEIKKLEAELGMDKKKD